MLLFLAEDYPIEERVLGVFLFTISIPLLRSTQ